MVWRRKWMNPFLKKICYICGESYHPGNCAIVSQVSGQELRAAHPGFFARFWVVEMKGRLVVREQAVRHCPHCNNELVDDADSYTIAIVGDSSSGKTHYIASCIHQLLQGHAAQMIGFTSLTPLGDTHQRYYDEYYQPIYLDRRKVPLSQRAGTGTPYRPLIYKMKFPSKPSINLLFYDASGEDIADPMSFAQYSHFVLDAAAIIFLADPMQMPKIVAKLPHHLSPQQTGQPIRPMTSGMVLNYVMKSFRDANLIDEGKKVKTPIAITLSKSDLLTFTASLDASSALYLYDNSYTNQLDIYQFKNISRQVEELISRFGDSQLILLSKEFEKVCFFAVTATGWTPDSNGEFPPLEPKRCLDPLLWALWQLGMINTEN